MPVRGGLAQIVRFILVHLGLKPGLAGDLKFWGAMTYIWSTHASYAFTSNESELEVHQ
jgi:hypothetical protein